MSLLDASGNPIEGAPDAKVIDINAHRRKKSLRVGICVPCRETVSSAFAFDLVRMVGATISSAPDVQLQVFQSRGSILPDLRQSLAMMALDTDCTHVLWLDSDQRFPKHTLMALLAHKEPIVAASYVTKAPPIEPVARLEDGSPLYTEPGATGLVEVAHVGMGAMLVDADVYRALPLPWFMLGYNPEVGRYQGEDVYFCLRVRQAGLRVLVDQGLSQEIAHIGEWEFRHGHALAYREAGAAGSPDGDQ